jgi:DNA-binding NarL/FixJ family response regulator
MTKPIRILLADDHDLLRAGLRVLLQTIADFEVVAEAGDGREALRLVKEHHPNVVLMDFMMPELNGLDATARITASFPKVHVIMLSMNAGEEYVLPALRAGAAGYLLKNVGPTEFEQAIRKVAEGETYLCSAVAKHVVAAYLEKTGDEKSSPERLTPRQREVLQLVAEGHSAKQIALKLDLSVRSVEAHRTQVMEALEIHDIASLTRYAIRMGLITPDA